MKKKEEKIPLTGIEVNEKEFMKIYTLKEIETIKKEINRKKIMSESRFDFIS